MTTATEAQKEHRGIDRETYLNLPVPTGVFRLHALDNKLLIRG